MRTHVPGTALAILLCIPAAAQTRVDPKISSVYPFSGQRGSTFLATVRGTGLTGASAAVAEGAPFIIAVERTESEPAETSGSKRGPTDLVTLRVSVSGEAKPGRYPVRLITHHGITNSLPLYITDLAVVPEPQGSHDTPDFPMAVTSFPAVFAGRLSRRGESDLYAFSAAVGQTLTFEVISGLPQIASGGSAATVPNFDPALSIFDAEGSWFDRGRLKRIAHNDEPAWVFGRSTDAHLVHRFPRAGRYLLRVEAFAGQGGPDYSYQLRITEGAVPNISPAPDPDWTERVWNRRLGGDHLNRIASRGGKPEDQKGIETYRASPTGAAFKLPGTVEGALSRPGEKHRATFRMDGPGDVVMEVETPAAAPPFFNPVVRLLNGSGGEVATNVFAGRAACSGLMTKSLQAKTVVPLREAGEYTLEIQDATADLAGPDFQYRVLVRPHIPHIGQVRIESDHLNFVPGEAKTMRVTFDREEDYRGALMVVAEGMPPGMSAAAGADFEPDKDDPLGTSKRERYTPRTERAVLVLAAGSDAPRSSKPHAVRVGVRPVTDGKVGEMIASKEVYVMVVEKP